MKILDFGLAKFREIDSAGSNTITGTGVVLGTLGYMAPEQLSGAPVGQHTDVFAVGVMLVEVLTERRPFQRDTQSELLRAVLLDTYHLPDSTPEIRTIDMLLQRCLAKRPEDRLSSVVELRQELIPALRACPPFPSPAEPPTPSGTRPTA